ncbi:hypothetical protein ISR92_01475 [Patescibacteria group bacterium]|nr:hypothetical protein [Patescibacteria group bacterium]
MSENSDLLRNELADLISAGAIFLALLLLVGLGGFISGEFNNVSYSTPLTIALIMYAVNIIFKFSKYPFRLSSLGYYGICMGICISALTSYVMGQQPASLIFIIFAAILILLAVYRKIYTLNLEKPTLYINVALESAVVALFVFLYVTLF